MAQFGTVFCDKYVSVKFADGAWQQPEMLPMGHIPMHPAAHVFHYASTCFEGFKAYRWSDGQARIYRLIDHVARMQKSAASLRLPVPEADFAFPEELVGVVCQCFGEKRSEARDPRLSGPKDLPMPIVHQPCT